MPRRGIVFAGIAVFVCLASSLRADFVVIKIATEDQQIERVAPLQGNVTALAFLRTTQFPIPLAQCKRMWIRRPCPERGDWDLLPVDFAAVRKEPPDERTNHALRSGDEVHLTTHTFIESHGPVVLLSPFERFALWIRGLFGQVD